MAVCTFIAMRKKGQAMLENMHSPEVGNSSTIFPPSDLILITWILKSRECKDEAVFCKVWIPLGRQSLLLPTHTLPEALHFPFSALH